MRVRPAYRLIQTFCALALAAVAAGEPDWPLTPEQKARLERGEVLVQADLARSGTAGDARAAVLVRAPRAIIYRNMTNCERALGFVPHLVHCQVLETSPDGRSELVEHEVDYGWYLPRASYVFRARYDPGQRVRFEAVSGDFRVNEGLWELVPRADGAVVVTYRVRLRPRFYVPRWLVRRSLRRELPALMRALRDASEREAALTPSP